VIQVLSSEIGVLEKEINKEVHEDELLKLLLSVIQYLSRSDIQILQEGGNKSMGILSDE